MASSSFVLLAFALVAVAYSLPYVEDSWDVEDELLQQIHSSSRPASVLIQEHMEAEPAAAVAAKNNVKIAAEAAKSATEAKETSVAHAKKMAEDSAKGAATAAAVEETWTKKEKQYAHETKALNKAARKAQRDMEASLAKDKKDLKGAQEDATTKIKETDDGTQAAQIEYQKMQKKYQNLQSAIRTESRESAKEAKGKAEVYKKDMAKIKGELHAETKEGEKIQANIIKTAKAVRKAKADAAINYKAKEAQLAKQAAADRAALEEEQRKAEQAMAATEKSNAAKAAASAAAVDEEARKNDLAAAKAKKQLNKRFAKVTEAQNKAKALYASKAAADAAALGATREGTAKKFQKAADLADLRYKKAMAKAASMQQKADHAQATYKQALADAAKEDAARAARTNAQDAKDYEMKSCEMDGSECEMPDGTCKKTGPKGPFLAADLVMCTDKEPKHQQYAGESWSGLPPPLPITPIAAPTAKCLALKKTFMATKYGKAITPGVCPTVAVACLKVPTAELMDKKAAMLQYFEMAAECPEWCVPGSATNDGDNQDTHGICITGQDVNIFKQQIADLPEWKGMGTNNKIPANFGIISICQMGKNFLGGFMDGSKA